MTQVQMLSDAIDLAVSTGLLHDIPSNGRLGHREVAVDAPVGATVTVTWHVPLSGAVGYWTSRFGFAKSLHTNWFAPTTASVTAEVPAGLLFDAQSRCTHAFAVSETVTEVAFRLAVSEEDKRINADVTLTVGTEPCRVRLYPPGFPYEDVLADIAAWWAERDRLDGAGSRPSRLPSAATEPVYSTWYGMHQQLKQQELDVELTLAADMGMRSAIIDDGWQTTDNQRGYAFTGDWEVAGSRFSDLQAHVDRTHSLGMAELLWISLPFVGRESAAARHLTHLLLPDDGRMARLWDVRLPEARSHLATICGRLVADHHLDGLKIDFIDEWSSYPSTPAPAAADTSSYSVGVDRLLVAIVTELRAVVDNPMIEFRQPYTGPRMMRYANMFRVADCPADGFQNRVSSVDLRHVIKERAVHTDMVMWTASDPAEDAAEQLLCTAFSVPQISMLLSQLPDDHTEMLRQYLAWWAANRDVLLWGRLWAPRPDLGYPLVTAVKDRHSVTIGYSSESVINVRPGRAVIANATGSDSVVVNLTSAATVEMVTDCFGAPNADSPGDLPAGLHHFSLPRGGSCVFRS
ncbi:MAG TPA: glycoside hydrolase family 36 protein [Propionibacteriaceae bacterium]|nr:glycoside hydrolase family 36 protein [Propionibacteriaceae bacterium]